MKQIKKGQIEQLIIQWNECLRNGKWIPDDESSLTTKEKEEERKGGGIWDNYWGDEMILRSLL